MPDYWRMSNKELELEARRFNVGEYAHADGTISRERIISQLITRESALTSRRSRIALALSVIAILWNVVERFFL